MRTKAVSIETTDQKLQRLWHALDSLLLNAGEAGSIVEDFANVLVREVAVGVILELNGDGGQDQATTVYSHQQSDQEAVLRGLWSQNAFGQTSEKVRRDGKPRLYEPESWNAGGSAQLPNSALIVPIGSTEEIVGTLTLVMTEESGQAFAQEELSFAADLASRALAVVACHRLASHKQREIAETLEYGAQLKKRIAIGQTVANSLGEGALAVDERGAITFINKAARTTLQVDADQVIGKCFHELVHPEQVCDGPQTCCLWHGLNVGADVQSHDDNFYCGGQGVLPVSFTLTRVSSEQSDSEMVIVFRDMSEYRNMQVRLMSTDRMLAVGTLAAGIAHEINNPLAYVQSNVRFVHQRLEREQSAVTRVIEEALSDAMEGVERIRSIVAGMRTFTGIGEGATLIDAEECLQNALTVCRGEVQTRARVQRRGESLGWVRANPARLTQVFVNLLMNAAAAVGDSGKFGRIIVTSGVVGGHQFIEFKDDGIGIDEETKKQIFDPFFTTRNVGDGTGLGLYICRAILREMGGDISLESSPGKGASFRVGIPRLDQNGAPLDGASSSELRSENN